MSTRKEERSDAESDPAGVVKVPTNCTSIGPPETVFHGR